MPHHHHDAAHQNAPDASLIELLELEGAVLHAYWSAVMSWLGATVAGSPADRIVDLGAGTGTAAIALVQHFDRSEVIAVDASAEMLERTREKARALGVEDRIRTVHADLDAGWPPIDGVDLTWASMSLHHVADPDRVLREVCAATRPGGLIAVAELGEPVRFLPDDVGVGRPGLEARCLEVMAAASAEEMPHLGSDWSPLIERAGFGLISEQTFTIAVDPPHQSSAGQLAQVWLERIRSGLADKLAPDDLDTLATLLDGDGPASVRRRDDLRIRGSRIVTLAQRPAKPG